MATTAHSILPNVRQHTILLTVFGSRAYGTHTPQSDVDLRGVAIPPAAYFHGFAHEFEQVDQPAALAPFRQDLTPEEQRIVDREGKVDGSVYDIRKFMRLAAGGNPSILEALFCREEEVRICTPMRQVAARQPARVLVAQNPSHLLRLRPAADAAHAKSPALAD